VPGSIKSGVAFKKGLPVSFTNAFGNSTDEISVLGTTGSVHSLRAARTLTKRLGHLVRSGVGAGLQHFKVKLSKRATKAVLGKKKSVKVQVLITVTVPGHQPATIAKFIKLKR
jgi:hypothetical protein